MIRLIKTFRYLRRMRKRGCASFEVVTTANEIIITPWEHYDGEKETLRIKWNG